MIKEILKELSEARRIQEKNELEGIQGYEFNLYIQSSGRSIQVVAISKANKDYIKVYSNKSTFYINTKSIDYFTVEENIKDTSNCFYSDSSVLNSLIENFQG